MALDRPEARSHFFLFPGGLTEGAQALYLPTLIALYEQAMRDVHQFRAACRCVVQVCSRILVT